MVVQPLFCVMALTGFIYKYILYVFIHYQSKIFISHPKSVIFNESSLSTIMFLFIILNSSLPECMNLHLNKDHYLKKKDIQAEKFQNN